MTYLELLQMIAEGTQPYKVKSGGCTYSWDGNEYVEDRDYDGIIYEDLGGRVGEQYTMKAQTTADIIAAPILAAEERRWLAVVISPFASKVVEIRKASSDDCEYIIINYRMDDYEDTIRLPLFKAGEHFKGMVKWKCYSPKELDL